MDQFYALFILLVFAAIVAIPFWFYFRHIRLQQERVFAPIEKVIQEFAGSTGYQYRKVPLYKAVGQRQLYQALPPGLPKVNGHPSIPMYSRSTEHRAMYRPAYILEKPNPAFFERMYLLPMFRSEGGKLQGVCFFAVGIPLTKHWLLVQTDEGPIRFSADQKVESNVFNRKYQLTGSDPKLITEVFDPLLIEQFNTYRGGTIFVRVRTGIVEVAVRGALTLELLTEARNISVKVKARFLTAYPAYPI